MSRRLVLPELSEEQDPAGTNVRTSTLTIVVPQVSRGYAPAVAAELYRTRKELHLEKTDVERLNSTMPFP